MSFKANDRGSNNSTPQEALKAATYPARVVQLVLLGLQPSQPFKGQEKAPQERIHVTYELSHEFMKDDEGNPDVTKPRWISEDFPFFGLGADRATSTQRYNAIDSDNEHDGDWSQLLGAPCQVTLSKEPRKKYPGTFANYVTHVSGAMNAPGYVQPPLVNPTKLFDVEEPDMEVFVKLPKWMQEKIVSNLNFNGSALQKALGTTPAPVATTAPTSSAPKPPAPSAPKAPAMPAAPPQDAS